MSRFNVDGKALTIEEVRDFIEKVDKKMDELRFDLPDYMPSHPKYGRSVPLWAAEDMVHQFMDSARSPSHGVNMPPPPMAC